VVLLSVRFLVRLRVNTSANSKRPPPPINLKSATPTSAPELPIRPREWLKFNGLSAERNFGARPYKVRSAQLVLKSSPSVRNLESLATTSDNMPTQEQEQAIGAQPNSALDMSVENVGRDNKKTKATEETLKEVMRLRGGEIGYTLVQRGNC
jgi:hypothetical protein